MSSEVRKGVSNAHFNEEQSSIFIIEVFVISIVAGLYYSSWWVFGGVLLGLIIAVFIKILSVPLTLAFSACWGYIGYMIGSYFESRSASIVLAIIGFLAGLGCHLAACEWVRDIGTPEKKE